MRRAAGVGNSSRPDKRQSTDTKAEDEFRDWQLDSTFDSKNLTTTRELDDFMATLGGPIPLAAVSEHLKPYARQIEAEIDAYLMGNNQDMQAKCIIAQELLRQGIERSPELIDELYLQLLRHLRGSNKHTSVRGWELLLLAACASRPSAKFLEPVNNFVYNVSHTKVQWPTTVSILSKRTWTALKHNTKPGRRVNVPSVGEIASVLTSKSMKVQVTFVDGSNKWLFYDWTTTVSSAVEQLASQIGLKNYTDYTLFEARKVPKKLDSSGGSVATLPPDSYLLLEDNRRIADVLHDYEVRGAQNKLLLKRKRFDSSEADFSKPQFIALTEAHQAAMDEKVAEVANLTLRLREMSGKVMWFEAQQDERKAEMEVLRKEVAAAEAKASEAQLKGVSIETAEVIRERNRLAERVRQLESSPANGTHARSSLDDEEGDWKPVALIRKLAQKQEEIVQLQAELEALRSVVDPGDLEKASELARSTRGATENGMEQSELKEDIEADMSEKEALYDLLRLQTAMEDEHAEEVAAKEAEVEYLKQMVEDLTARTRKGGTRSLDDAMYGSPGSAQDDNARELRKSLDEGRLRNNVTGSDSSFSDQSSQADHKEQLEMAAASCMALEGKLRNVQDALEHQSTLTADLEAELETTKQQLQNKEGGFRKQERDWRVQLNAANAETATIRSRLKAREAALAQAQADLDELHKEAAKLKTELDTKDWELECAAANVASAVADKHAAQAVIRQLKSGNISWNKAASGEVNKKLTQREQEVSTLTERLMAVLSERDAALDKLSSIQQLMFGSSQELFAANPSTNSNPNGSGVPATPKENREGKAKLVNDNCPLEIGRDPRRESIGGASAPEHLRGLPPLRVLPEEKRALGTRHPLFAPKYVSPLVAATPERRESKTVRQEANAMLDIADARRRLYKQGGKGERPAPSVQTTPRLTSRINTGSHLLGLLSNTAITQSQESLGDADEGTMASGGAEDYRSGTHADLMRSNSSAASHQEVGRSAGGYMLPGTASRSNSATDAKSILNSGGMTSTQSEPDLLKAYEAALRAED